MQMQRLMQVCTPFIYMIIMHFWITMAVTNLDPQGGPSNVCAIKLNVLLHGQLVIDKLTYFKLAQGDSVYFLGLA